MNDERVTLNIKMERPTCNMCPFARESYTECMFLFGDEILPNNNVAHEDCPFADANTVYMTYKPGSYMIITRKE